MVPMDANQFVGIGMRLFQHRIVHDEHRELVGRSSGLGLANQRFGLPPHLGRAVAALTQPARDVVVAQRPLQSSRDKPVAVVGPVELSK